MFRNYFTTALRNLFRNKIYSLINILGLTLGLAAAMLIMLYVKDETSFDHFHAKVNNIYRIVTKEIDVDGSVKRIDGNTGIFQGPRFASNVSGIQSFARIQETYQDIQKGTEVQSQQIYYVDSNFLSMFSFPVVSGNPKTALLQPNSLVISEEIAKKQFGNDDALNKIIMVKDQEKFVPYTVTAVTKKCPQNSSIKFDMLMPIKIAKEDAADNTNWFNFFLNTFVVVAPNTNIKSAEAQMQKVYESDAKETIKMMADKYDFKGKQFFFLQPFTDMHLSKDLPASNGLTDASNPVYSYILTGIAIFILLIACINFINLTIARSIKRAKEIGIRKVVGGDRKQLIMQFLGESFILCFIAFAFALLIVQLILPVFNQLANKSLALSYLFDAKLITGYLILFLLTGLLAGFYPALVLSNYNPVQTLYSRFKLGGKNYLQKSLVVLQFSLASFLIIATFTIFSQFNYLTTEKLGYDDSNLIMINKSNIKQNELAVLKNELLKNPSIINIAPRNGGSWGTIAKVNGDSSIQFDYELTDESFIPLLKIPVIQGRNFSADFPSDSTQSVIVNEAFVKQAGWKNPIGQEVNFWYRNNEKYKVIGVVKDYHYESLNQKIGPELFSAKTNNRLGMVFIKIKPNSEASSLQHIQKIFKSLFPYVPYSYKFKDQENFKNYEAEGKWKQIMLFSAILTIFISCIGLFGLSVLSAEKRTKEIGIRKVLGASVGGVVTILSKDFLKLVLIALVISIPLAWMAANKWLENYPYRITLNWMMFAVAALLVIIIALVTISFHAIKAAIANPVKSLRTE
ncbi:MAG TPA: ABC transporter permease [Puia sp.]|nr:ABC transporter permease [Puia sp.]